MARGDDPEPARVLPHVFLGSKAHARDRELLARLQITHVLNVTPPKSLDPVAGVPNFFEKDKALTYRRCPIFDNKAEDISGLLEGCVAFIEQAKYYGRVLVHCSKGVSRSASMVAAYLMKSGGMSCERALQFVADKRPVANPNASFRCQLEDFGEKLRREAAARAARNKNTSGGATRAAGVRGPQGPPTRGGAAEEDAIGPQLPPPKHDGSSSSSRQQCSSPAKAVPTAAIGPQLPPHLQRKAQEGDEEELVIGPSLPPTHKRRREATESTDGASPRAKAARSD